MKTERRIVVAVVLALVPVVFSGAVRADWMPEDGHKMHYPQLPDPDGWDVDVTVGFVADNWMCSQSGAVNDIHFWISAERDYVGNWIDFIDVAIYDDVAAVAGDPGSYSHPGEKKWSSRVQDQAAAGDTFTIFLPPKQGDQGWYSPYSPAGPGYYALNDHTNYWQVNIENIVDPFVQSEGKTYWLEIHIIPNNVPGGECPFFGWKTSLDHWNDDAVYLDGESIWQELYDPRPDYQGVSLDMAFVITPEPVTLIVLVLGLFPILLMKRHRKRTA